MPSRFVHELELPEIFGDHRIALLRVHDGGSGKGFVDAGSMVSFTNKLTATHESDVLNSTLLAQLAAKKSWRNVWSIAYDFSKKMFKKDIDNKSMIISWRLTYGTSTTSMSWAKLAGTSRSSSLKNTIHQAKL